MDSQEKNLITNFFERISAQTSNRALPPVDPEANQLIAQELNRNPEAPYRLTQLAVVQESALVRANQKIQQLEALLQQAQGSRGGFFSNIFGGRGRPASGPRVGAMPPGYQQPGVMPSYAPSAGTGFLGSALTTAAGVAGGIMAAEAIESMFSGHGEGLMGGSGAPLGGGDATAAGVDPFGGSGAEVQGYDNSDFGGGYDDSGFGSDDFGGGFDDDLMF